MCIKSNTLLAARQQWRIFILLWWGAARFAHSPVVCFDLKRNDQIRNPLVTRLTIGKVETDLTTQSYIISVISWHLIYYYFIAIITTKDNIFIVDFLSSNPCLMSVHVWTELLYARQYSR